MAKKLKYVVFQDRHAYPELAYAFTKREARKIAAEWDRVYGPCGQVSGKPHFHKTEVWKIQDFIKTYGLPEKVAGEE